MMIMLYLYIFSCCNFFSKRHKVSKYATLAFLCNYAVQIAVKVYYSGLETKLSSFFSVRIIILSIVLTIAQCPSNFTNLM